jgi:hypothetical protein
MPFNPLIDNDFYHADGAEGISTAINNSSAIGRYSTNGTVRPQTGDGFPAARRGNGKYYVSGSGMVITALPTDLMSMSVACATYGAGGSLSLRTAGTVHIISVTTNPGGQIISTQTGQADRVIGTYHSSEWWHAEIDFVRSYSAAIPPEPSPTTSYEARIYINEVLVDTRTYSSPAADLSDTTYIDRVSFFNYVDDIVLYGSSETLFQHIGDVAVEALLPSSVALNLADGDTNYVTINADDSPIYNVAAPTISSSGNYVAMIGQGILRTLAGAEWALVRPIVDGAELGRETAAETVPTSYLAIAGGAFDVAVGNPNTIKVRVYAPASGRIS